MVHSFLPTALLVLLTAGADAAGVRTVRTSLAGGPGPHYPRQANATTIASRVETGIQTECKTCPYSLCTNQLALEYGTEMTLACWAFGDNIVDSNIWLKTTDGCYVAQWDIIEYAGDYTNTPGFPSCGINIPKTYTTATTATTYHTECNINPTFASPEDHIKMYKPEVDLTVTCYTDEGSDVLGNTRWYKTLSNCYVPEAQLEPITTAPGSPALEACGPIPFMERKMREPDNIPAPAPPGLPRVGRKRAGAEHAADRRWLYVTQVGEDSADCTAEARAAPSKIVRSYAYGSYLVVQCATLGPADEERQIYLLTDDFCWVNDTLTDPQLIDSEVRSQRYPNCNLFVDTEV